MRKKGFTTEEILSQSNGRLTLDEIHGRLKELIYHFDQFCKANSLTYYPAGGTLIGTIRHNGFIPWDDDVDFYMPREDYEKLIKHSQDFAEINTTIHSSIVIFLITRPFLLAIYYVGIREKVSL